MPTKVHTAYAPLKEYYLCGYPFPDRRTRTSPVPINLCTWLFIYFVFLNQGSSIHIVSYCVLLPALSYAITYNVIISGFCL